MIHCVHSAVTKGVFGTIVTSGLNPIDLPLALLASGLARIDDRSIQFAGNESELRAAERAAKVSRLRIWEHYSERRKEDRLVYLDQVKLKFERKPKIYNQILGLLKEFNAHSIDMPSGIERALRLFDGDRELILGFNTLLPPGYKIEYDGDAPKVTMPLSSLGAAATSAAAAEAEAAPPSSGAVPPHRIESAYERFVKERGEVLDLEDFQGRDAGPLVAYERFVAQVRAEWKNPPNDTIAERKRELEAEVEAEKQAAVPKWLSACEPGTVHRGVVAHGLGLSAGPAGSVSEIHRTAHGSWSSCWRPT